jgi:CHASE1-domain containing sensor protein
MKTLGRLIPDSKMKWQYFLPVAMIAIGVGLSLTGFLVLQQREYREIELSFKQDAAERYDSLKKEIDLDIQTLEAITAFYQASREVTRSDFHNFVKPLLDRHQSIQALEWIPRVTARQREMYEKAARHQGHPGFEFTERDAQGQMTRSRGRLMGSSQRTKRSI